MPDKMEETNPTGELLSYPFSLQDIEADDEKVKEIEERFFNLLKVINEDTRQLSEFLVEEESLVKEICACLKDILHWLDLSVTLPAKQFSNLKEYREVILNSQGHLIFVDEEGKVESKALETCPPETILLAVWGAVPKIKETVSDHMRKVSFRLNFFEKINEEFKNIQKSLEVSKEEAVKGSYDEFQQKSIREVILSEK